MENKAEGGENTEECLPGIVSTSPARVSSDLNESEKRLTRFICSERQFGEGRGAVGDGQGPALKTCPKLVGPNREKNRKSALTKKKRAPDPLVSIEVCPPAVPANRQRKKSEWKGMAY